MKLEAEITRIKKAKLKKGKFCRGCYGTSSLTASHVIRRSAREDLATKEDNITIHCMDCHNKWDSNIIDRMIQLNDFADSLYYISQVDKERFFRLMFKIQEYVKTH